MKSHCRNGHERTKENTMQRPDGRIECNECASIRDKARYPARKDSVVARAKTWMENNPEKFKASQAKQELRPEVKERRKKFYEKTKSAIWRRYSHLKANAKRYNREFTLTFEDYENMVTPNSCHYCSGSLPEAGTGTDRQDNKLGYTKENSVACCERCNEKKGSLEGLGFTYPRTVELLKELLG